MIAVTSAVVFFVLLLSPCCNCYYHVVLMHGIFSSNASMTGLMDMITKAHPGTKVSCNQQSVYIVRFVTLHIIDVCNFPEPSTL